jgi:hypothetical protein
MGSRMPIWRVELTGEWTVEDIEAVDEYEAEDLAIDYIYNTEPDYISGWATKVREDDGEEENG